MRLYKYVGTADAVRSIASGHLKFTPVDELNDPSELTPIMNHDAVRSSLQALRSEGLTSEQFAWLRCQEETLDTLSPEKKVIRAPTSIEAANRMLRHAVYDDLNYMQATLYETIQLIRQRIGIFSASERFDSLPMWAHYARLARGYVVAFDDLADLFAEDCTGSLNVAKPVKYEERFSGMTFDPSTQDALFFCKLADWSYEKEWRVVSALSACGERRADGLYLRRFPELRIASVILGWNAPMEETERLRSDLEVLVPHCSVAAAKLADGCLELN